MALPIKPNKPEPENESSNEIQYDDEGLPIGGIVPKQETNIPTQPKSNILEIGEGLDKLDMHRIDEKEDIVHTPKFTRITVGQLTSEDVLTKRYEDTLAPFQDKIIEVTDWAREVYSERGQDDLLSQARRNRGKDYEEQAAKIDNLLVKYFSEENIVRSKDAPIIIAAVINELLGLGPIEPLWQDPRISEIMVNGPYDVKVEIEGKVRDAPGAHFRDAKHLLDVCQQILGDIGREVNIQRPTADGRLPDQSRINVVHNIIAPEGPFLTIRRFPDTVFTIKELVERKSMTEEIAVEIGNLIYKGCSVIIAGSTGSGKTSALNALSGAIPFDERVITIEDNLELRLNPTKHVLAMEAKQASASGEGSVTIRDLVKNSLRMRPDRIVVGEVRDEAAYDMLQAMNTGHDGSMTTVHANDPEGTIDRLVNLISQVGDFAPERALALIAGGVDAIVIVERYEDGSRRVSTIAEVPSVIQSDGRIVKLVPNILWEFHQTGTERVTDSDGNEKDKIVGEYVRVNELSEATIRKHRLDKKKDLTLEEIYQISDIPK